MPWENGRKMPTIDVVKRTMSPPNSHGASPSKLYLVWKANSVRPPKTPSVMRSAAEGERRKGSAT